MLNFSHMDNIKDCVIIGGGQSGLACGYFLRREKIDFTILDAESKAGGAWLHGWDSLTLFSPPEFSSLPGFQMPASKGEFPSKDEVINYLSLYEKRYNFNIERDVEVQNVKKENDIFTLKTNKGDFYSKTLICSTGTYKKPFLPNLKGLDNFAGDQFHSSQYKNPSDFVGRHVLIVGEGNSGAQIVAELSNETVTYWAVKSKPEFLPDDVDGRVLFDSASAVYYAKQRGEKLDQAKINLGNIVMVPSVKKAKEKGGFDNYNFIDHFTRNGVVWKNGDEVNIDAIIWCTGFGYHLDYLESLISFDDRGRPKVNDNESQEKENLFYVGFGGWTGFASATLIGVGRTAKKVAKKISDLLIK